MSAQPARIYPLHIAETEPENLSQEKRFDDAAASQTIACSYCYGSGMEVIAGKGARRCQCRSQDRQAKLLEQARIPSRYERCSLSSYQPARGNGTQLQAFNYAFKLIDEYPAIDRGLLLMGTVGVGKTHLSAAILRGLVEKGVPCLFYEFGALLKEIQNSFNPVAQTSELNVLAPVYEAEVLVLAYSARK